MGGLGAAWAGLPGVLRTDPSSTLNCGVTSGLRHPVFSPCCPLGGHLSSMGLISSSPCADLVAVG